MNFKRLASEGDLKRQHTEIKAIRTARTDEERWLGKLPGQIHRAIISKLR